MNNSLYLYAVISASSVFAFTHVRALPDHRAASNVARTLPGPVRHLKKTGSFTGQPFLFRENKGQVRDQHGRPRRDILFSGSAQGLEYFLKGNGVQYQLSRRKDNSTMIRRIDVTWVGANGKCGIRGSQPVPGVEHFYNTPDGRPALHVRQYQRVMYKNLYPGIDLIWYLKNGKPEYDFLVHPGADISKIKLRIGGARIWANAAGELVMATSLGQVREGRLRVYQAGRQVSARWKVQGNEAGFEVLGKINPGLPLTIDPPVRAWGTYYGGTRGDVLYGVDTYGNDAVYAAGVTLSDGSGIIATTGAHQVARGSTSTSGSSGNDAFLVKFNAAGVRQWATYYGGTFNDQANDCATDAEGNVYLAGSSGSTSGIATPGAFLTGIAFGSGFVAKFNSAGVRQWGTYIASAGSVQVCTTDTEGNVLVGGSTTASTNIATANAHQTDISGLADVDGFIVKFSGTGSRLWGTYYGGVGDDIINGLCVDKNNNIFFAGTTSANSGIASPGAHLATAPTPDIYNTTKNAFVGKMNSAGVRQWATYYGGGQNDMGLDCGVDADGNVILTGSAISPTGIATPGAFMTTKAAGLNGITNGDAFIVKFTGDGVRLWGTYYGHDYGDQGNSCQTDAQGNIYIGGTTNSPDNIATSDAFQKNLAVAPGAVSYAADAFLLKMDASGKRLWCTYYGDITQDGAEECNVADDGSIYMVGGTNSIGTLLATAGSHQTALSGGFDGNLVKIQETAVTTPPVQFTGSGNWSNPSNWQGGVVPSGTIPAGTVIVIDPGGNGECNLDIPLTVASGASIRVAAGKKLILNGNLTIL